MRSFILGRIINFFGVFLFLLGSSRAAPGEESRFPVTSILTGAHYDPSAKFARIKSLQARKRDTTSVSFDSTLNPGNGQKIFQGGDNIGSATVISSLPYSATGTTVGYTDDYDETCPFFGPTSPDVVYSYQPAANQSVDISLCGSSYDTKLYLYENTYTPGLPYACNDDFCDLQSRLIGVNLVAGRRYYLVVDGFSGDAGPYTINFAVHIPCVVGCPSGGRAENEACGGDINGGCNSITPVFQTINFGDTICGTAWADTLSRDTDWFRKVLSSDTIVAWSVVAEFPVQLLIVNITKGCDSATIMGSAFVDICDTASIVTPLNAGTYAFFVAPAVFTGFACASGPWHYSAWLTARKSCGAAKGDMNGGGGGLTPADGVLMLSCVFLGNGSGTIGGDCNLCYADVNCSGDLSAADAVLELNAVFLGGPFPC